jgi:hypothetical protein
LIRIHNPAENNVVVENKVLTISSSQWPTNITQFNFLILQKSIYIGKYPLPPCRGISANVIWGKKYEQGKRTSGKMRDKKEERGKKKEKRREKKRK